MSTQRSHAMAPNAAIDIPVEAFFEGDESAAMHVDGRARGNPGPGDTNHSSAWNFTHSTNESVPVIYAQGNLSHAPGNPSAPPNVSPLNGPQGIPLQSADPQRVSFAPINQWGEQFPRANAQPPTPQSFGPGSSSTGNQSQVETPTKSILRNDIAQLRATLSDTQAMAYHAMSTQQRNFEDVARRYEQEARDVTQAEIAQSTARVQAQATTQLSQAKGVNDRANLRLQSQSRLAKEKQEQLEQYANEQMEIQRKGLIEKANAAMLKQQEDLVIAANDKMAQRQDALIHEAREAIHDQAQELQAQQIAMEAKAEQYMQQLMDSAEGNLRQKDLEIQQLQFQLQQSGQVHQATHATQSQDAQHQANQLAAIQGQMQQQETQHVAKVELYWKTELGQFKSEQASQVAQMQMQMENTCRDSAWQLAAVKNASDLLQQSHAAQLHEAQADAEMKASNADYKMRQMEEKMDFLQTTIQTMHNTHINKQSTQNFDMSTPRPMEEDEEETGAIEEEEGYYDEETGEWCEYSEDDQAEWREQEKAQEAYLKAKASKAGQIDPGGAPAPGGAPGGAPGPGGPGGNEPPATPVPPVPALREERDRFKEADEIKFDKMPQSRQMRMWKINTRKKIAGASGRPKAAFIWWGQADHATTFEELEDDGDFESLSAKIASGFANIIHGEFARQIEYLEQQLALTNKMLNGRQIYWLINQELSRSNAEGHISEFEDLLAVELEGDNLQKFQITWNQTLLAMTDKPEIRILESLYDRQIAKSGQLKLTMAVYKADITQHKTEKT